MLLFSLVPPNATVPIENKGDPNINRLGPLMSETMSIMKGEKIPWVQNKLFPFPDRLFLAYEGKTIGLAPIHLEKK